MRKAWVVAVLLLAGLGSTVVQAAGVYPVEFRVRFLPAEGVAAVEIETRRGEGRLKQLDLAMPAADYRAISGDGTVQREGDRLQWTPPKAGGVLRYQVLIDNQRSNGQFDSLMTDDWMITRADRLFPPARVRATRGSRSRSRLSVTLPSGWTAIETPYPLIGPRQFSVVDRERSFDRPVGWIAAGQLMAARDTVGSTRVTVTAPQDLPGQVQTLALIRLALPVMAEAFGALPSKLLVVRGADPIWRGGLSAPRSLLLHSERPLLSENATSTLLHELSHVISGIRGGPGDDWIAEGIAEFYSLDIARRSGLISTARFDRAIRLAGEAGTSVDTLHAEYSNGSRTRKAVALFAALDRELRQRGRMGLDALMPALRQRREVSLADLQALAAQQLGAPSTVLAAAR